MTGEALAHRHQCLDMFGLGILIQDFFFGVNRYRCKPPFTMILFLNRYRIGATPIPTLAGLVELCGPSTSTFDGLRLRIFPTRPNNLVVESDW